MKRHPLFVAVRFGLMLLALGGLTAPSHAQTKSETTANAVKAAPVIVRLEKAIAGKDKLGAEDVLAELEGLVPSDGRLAGWRERVAAVPEPKKNLTVDLGGGVTMDFVLVRPGSFTMATCGNGVLTGMGIILRPPWTTHRAVHRAPAG